jgi:hypothetical protein
MRQLAADGAGSSVALAPDWACALGNTMLPAMHPASNIHLAREVIMLIT